MKVEIFDPSMCCSTGVCGPGVDPELLRMASIVSGMQLAGREVLRHNLSEEPQAYVDNAAVNEVLMNEGVEALPITLVDGEVRKKGTYPSNAELMVWADITENELIMAQLRSKMTGCSCGCGGDKKEGGGCGCS